MDFMTMRVPGVCQEFRSRIGNRAAHLDTTTASDGASLSLPARHERREGLGEGFVSAAATFFGCPSPLPSPHFFVVGRGNPLVAMVVVSRCARNRGRAFTLIELLVVIAIIAILAAMLL